MDYMILKEAGDKWEIPARIINYYCSAGQISGAERMGGSVWLMPKYSDKPIDSRTK